MLRSQRKLLALAGQFGIKYAGLDATTIANEVKQTLTTALANASTANTSGIMPFNSMLLQDQAVLALSITRDGNVVKVSPPGVDPIEVAGKYAELSSQVQRYLTSNLEVFPSHRSGTSVEYHHFTVRLEFPDTNSPDIAKR